MAMIGHRMSDTIYLPDGKADPAHGSYIYPIDLVRRLGFHRFLVANTLNYGPLLHPTFVAYLPTMQRLYQPNSRSTRRASWLHQGLLPIGLLRRSDNH